MCNCETMNHDAAHPPQERSGNAVEYTFSDYQESERAIREKIGDFRPEVALVLGSGLGFLGDVVEDAVAVDTTGKSQEESFDLLLNLIRRQLAQ